MAIDDSGERKLDALDTLPPAERLNYQLQKLLQTHGKSLIGSQAQPANLMDFIGMSLTDFDFSG
jgi:hypothetical protein